MAELLTYKQFQQTIINSLYALNIRTLRSYQIVIDIPVFCHCKVSVSAITS